MLLLRALRVAPTRALLRPSAIPRQFRGYPTLHPPRPFIHTRLLSVPPQSSNKPSEPSQPPLLTHLRTRYATLKTLIHASPYAQLMRLDKPTGTHLLFLPSAWAITLVASPTTGLQLLPLFYLGATLLRGAGCTANDILDADIDRRITRTQTRPLARGAVTQPAALAFLTAQLTAGLCVLTQLNSLSFLVGSLSVIPVLFYPLAKRRLQHPQAVLALTFNTGALLGYTAATGTLALPAFTLHAAGACWTMVYDTLYAHQDAADDRKVGIGSSALAFGSSTRPVLSAFVAGKAGLLAATGASCGLGWPFFAGVAGSSAYLLKLVWWIDLTKPEECGKAFRRSANAGGVVWAAILAGRMFAG